MLHILVMATAPLVTTLPARPPAAPPIIATSRTVVVQNGRPAAETLSFGVVIRQDDHEIWSGELTMATNSNANYSQRKSQSVLCPSDPDRVRAAQFQTSLDLSLSQAYGLDSDRAVMVSLQLQRPAEASAAAMCQNDVTRTVSLRGTIRPEKGKPVTVAGDAGLTMMLTLR